MDPVFLVPFGGIEYWALGPLIPGLMTVLTENLELGRAMLIMNTLERRVIWVQKQLGM